MEFKQLRRSSSQILKIAKKFRISRILVFGSVARGSATTQSDVDFLVEIEEGASLFGVAGFGYEVQELLGVPVDVIPVSVLPMVEDQEFVLNIQKDAIPL